MTLHLGTEEWRRLDYVGADTAIFRPVVER
jgi:hypothetical protein